MFIRHVTVPARTCYNQRMIIFTVFYLLALFLLGAILGSFLNVVAVDSMNVYMKNNLAEKSELRFIWNTIRSKGFWKHLVTHRSSCDTCSTVLTPKELVPVVSYLWQKGHCRTCETPFSPQHLYVEILSGAIFLTVFLTVFEAHTVLGTAFIGEVFYMFLFFGLAIILFLFDYEHMIVPNLLVYPLVILAFGTHILGFASVPQVSLVESLIAAVVLAVPLFLLWAFSKGTWMGMADSKIALVMGALLGLSLGLSAWVISFWIGAIIALILVATDSYVKKRSKGDKQVTMKSAIPFGPFMVLALWFVYISGYGVFPF